MSVSTSPTDARTQAGDHPYDCVIVGAGPAGLSAALLLGRARRRVLVVDGDRPRNRATYMAHGFMTRDGIPPMELRRLAREDIARYPSVEFQWGEVDAVRGRRPSFRVLVRGVRGAASREVSARTVLLATGLQEVLPAVPDIVSYYGTSLFSCVHCDGWEHRGREVAVIGEIPQVVELAQRVSQWSTVSAVFTNGHRIVNDRGIPVREERVAALAGDRGRLSAVLLDDGDRLEVSGGFVQPVWQLPEVVLDAVPTAGDLGGVRTDEYGRSGVAGIYAGGDIRGITPSQIIIAAGDGARAATGVNNDLIAERFAG